MEIFCAHGLEDCILSKCPQYSEQSTNSGQSLSKSQQHFFFAQLEKKILKFIWISKDFKYSILLRKKNKTEGFILADFKTNWKAKLIKTVWYWQWNRHIDQWKRLQDPEMNTWTYGQLIYDKVGKNIKWRKYRLFNKWFWDSYM